MGAFTALALCYKMRLMATRLTKKYTLVACLVGSFLCLVLCMLLTNPVSSLAILFLFFISLLIFLISFGYTLLFFLHGSVDFRSKNKVYIYSLILVAILMLRSANSLTIIDLLILLLICFGLVFYTLRRAS